MTFSALLALGWLGLAPTPPAPVPVPVPVPAPPPAASVVPTSDAKEAPPTVYTFTLGPKSEQIPHCTHADAKGEGKIEVEAGENQLKSVLGAAAGANVFLGAESTATQTVQLVQEFEIRCSNPEISQVYLTLESTLLGFLRSKHKATAGLRLASASITPVGWAATPLSVNYPTVVVGGPHPDCRGGAHGHKYETPVDPVKSPPMPLGRYVLQANFVVSATAGGLLDAHSTAIFMAESEELDPWEREHDPFKGDSHDDFGFTLTLKADAPPGFPAVARRSQPKKVASRPRTRHAH